MEKEFLQVMGSTTSMAGAATMITGVLRALIPLKGRAAQIAVAVVCMLMSLGYRAPGTVPEWTEALWAGFAAAAMAMGIHQAFTYKPSE